MNTTPAEAAEPASSPTPREHRYDALVSACSREEAIAIAAEALPIGKRASRVYAVDVAQHEGPDSWQITLYFLGEFGRGHIG